METTHRERASARVSPHSSPTSALFSVCGLGKGILASLGLFLLVCGLDGAVRSKADCQARIARLPLRLKTDDRRLFISMEYLSKHLLCGPPPLPSPPSPPVSVPLLAHYCRPRRPVALSPRRQLSLGKTQTRIDVHVAGFRMLPLVASALLLHCPRSLTPCKPAALGPLPRGQKSMVRAAEWAGAKSPPHHAVTVVAGRELTGKPIYFCVALCGSSALLAFAANSRTWTTSASKEPHALPCASNGWLMGAAVLLRH